MAMKAITRFLLLSMALLLLAACQQTAEPAAAIDLAGTSWQLSSLNGRLPVADTTVTLEFGTDESVSGTDGCNRFATAFTQDGANLTIDQATGVTTMMALSLIHI